MSIAQNFPEIRPSLNLDFANVKALDPRVTFARASTGAYYDGQTVAKAEENLWSYSQNLENNVWVDFRSTVGVDATTAPDGTETAESFAQQTGQVSSGGAYRITPIISGNTYTISVFAKPNGKNFLAIRETFTGSKDTWFDVSTGVVGTTAAGHTAVITPVANGFYRCSVSFTASVTGNAIAYFFLADTDGSLIVADDGNGLFLWGAQLEQRSAVTAYTPTTTQPITNYIPVLQTASANVARFDHNPVTGESLGLLVEEQRTNLFQRSEEFDNAYWQKIRTSITANTIIAPDGALTGDKLVENTDTNSHFLAKVETTTNTNPLTWSVYAKAGERPNLSFAVREATTFTRNASALFDLSAGTVGAVSTAGGTSAASATITAVGNGWYRCTLTCTLGGTDTNSQVLWQLNNGVATSYTGDGYSGIYIWGAQLEAGAFPTSYIPTVASQVTRSADSASMTGRILVIGIGRMRGRFMWRHKHQKLRSDMFFICLVRLAQIDIS
jgi:hypothetical protein